MRCCTRRTTLVNEFLAKSRIGCKCLTQTGIFRGAPPIKHQRPTMLRDIGNITLLGFYLPTRARLFCIGRKIRGGICGILKQRKSAARAPAKSKRPKASEAITATQRVGTQTGGGAGTQGAAHAPVACTAGRPADEHSPVSALAKQVGSLRLLEFLVGSRGFGIPCWKPRGRPC